ncbi:MAG: coproporphyrinogen dehydrogenase, partial [Cyclobacteriaceae bacterium]|nr:coproporphyrinogen dehydrogenase [Cyclobacteriaceae bacterium HetDA_MAG_MS6]
REFDLYLALLPGKPQLKELHLGGGTPTFFHPESLKKLISGILRHVTFTSNTHMSLEGHPANTTEEHLRVLASLGFDRISFGIQDFDPQVQKIINRRQTRQQVESCTELARQYGFRSINYDLIYGLPGQTIDTLKQTIEITKRHRPDRIAFYSYAHVPTLKPAQKAFEHLLPSAQQKQNFYQEGKTALQSAGYCEVGMDHFTLSVDELFEASQTGKLHRNFMGYTTTHTQLLLGLGVSAISDSWSGFAQNTKHVEDYYNLIDRHELPISRGHHSTQEDLFVRSSILDLMCRNSTTWNSDELHEFGIGFNWELINELIADELIDLYDHTLVVTQKGRPFLRNVCMSLDQRLWRREQTFSGFSKAI